MPDPPDDKILSDFVLRNAKSPLVKPLVHSSEDCPYQIQLPISLTTSFEEVDLVTEKINTLSLQDNHSFSMCAPNPFQGNTSEYENFLFVLSNHFRMYPSRFSKNNSKVIFLFSYLRGLASDWACRLLESSRSLFYDFEGFVSLFKKRFGPRYDWVLSTDKLIKIKQMGCNFDSFFDEFECQASFLKIKKNLLKNFLLLAIDAK
jgi:Domain of unknown function (DUF4939)